MKPIVISALFDVSIEEVWSALSKKEELIRWYFPVRQYEFTEGEMFSFYESNHSENYLHHCRFLKIKPFRKIETSWSHPEHSAGSSVVSWKLEPAGSRTKVTLVHTGVENFSDAGPEFSRENFQVGWTTIVHKNLRNHLYGVEKLCFISEIPATPDVVWEKLWDQEAYKKWAGEFTPGSYYKGVLRKGNRIQFLAPDGDGMYSEITECNKHKNIVFKHIGWIHNYEEMPVDEETGRWTGNVESYQLIPHQAGTVLRVEVEAVEEHKDFFRKSLPKAFEKLNQLCATSGRVFP